MSKGLFLGDSMIMLPKLDASSVDVIITDPPYGINFRSNYSKRFDKIINDDRPYIDWIPEAYRVTRDGGSIVCFCRWDVQEVFREAITAAGFTIKSQLIWYKIMGGMGDLKGSFRPAHEIAWFATKADGFEFRNGRPSTVLKYRPVDLTSMSHPTEKPVSMMSFLIKKLSIAGETVLDPFVGSGSVLVAAKNNGVITLVLKLTKNTMM